MKRSNMEMKLEYFFKFQQDKIMSDKQKAQKVLQYVLDWGMLPPNDLYTNSDDTYLLEHYNKWEEEDESN